ncbi:murein L,D-transpeptidase family protein [Mucilaginibacter sp. AW1-3]
MIKKISAYITLMAFVAAIVYARYPEKKLPVGVVIDRILVIKSKRQMLVYHQNKLIKTYKISLGFCPIGKKQVDGDGKTPEGLYRINAKNPNSVCHKNLGISYPDANDIATAKKLVRPTGGDIKIHGLKNGYGFIGKFHRWRDWTDGCIGLTDTEIDDLYAHTPIGTPIQIKP